MSQRVDYLASLLVLALSHGISDPSTGEPLKVSKLRAMMTPGTHLIKNTDTDELLEEDRTESVFYVSSAIDPTSKQALSPEQCLHDLRITWPDRFERFKLPEQEFMQQYNDYLQGLADVRIQYVKKWLTVNTMRFGERIEITPLFRKFEGLAKELKAAVALCGITCSSCGLKCIEQKYHSGRHDCKTSHRCANICAYVGQHDEDIPQCDMPCVYLIS